MYTTTSRRRRYSARAAAIASTAIIFGAAACGTETASDKGEPAAPPAPAAQVQAEPYTPMSADAAERWGASERRARERIQEEYLRHLDRAAKQQQDQAKLRRQSSQAPGHGREIPIP
jgi:hypothetical protein